MSIQRFPYEILINIFRLAAEDSDRRSVLEFALVCRSWNLPASRVSYEEININQSTDLDSLINQNNKLSAHCTVLRINGVSGDGVGTFYEMFSIYRDYGEYLKTMKHFERLLLHLPNLKTVIINKGTNRVEYLHKITQNAKLIQGVKEIILTGDMWGQIESQAYYDCIMAFKHTIRNIRLFSLNQMIRSNNGVSGYIVSFLSEFTSLTSLEIKNREHTNYPRLPQLSMLRVLSSYPNLITFAYDTPYLKPDATRCDNFCDHSKLRYLDISVARLTIDQVNYLVNNVTQLKQFKLGHETKATRVKTWFEKYGHVDRLQSYLKRIEKVEFTLLGSYEVDLVDYEALVSSIISNTQLTPIHLYAYLDGRARNSDRLRLEKGAANACLYFELYAQNMSSVNSLLTFPTVFKAEKYTISLLKIQLEPISCDATRLYVDYLRIIKISLDCFRDIQHLNLNVKNSSLFYYIGAESNQVGSAFRSETKNCLTVYSSCNPSTNPNNISYVLLRNLKTTEDITSALSLLPNTKYLRLMECNLTKDSNHNFSLDLKNLKLQQLELDLTNIALTRGKMTVVLLIKAQEPRRTSCYRWKRRNMRFDIIEFESVNDHLYLKRYGRYKSQFFNAIIIKCRTLEQVKIDISRPIEGGVLENTLDLTN